MRVASKLTVNSQIAVIWGGPHGFPMAEDGGFAQNEQG